MDGIKGGQSKHEKTWRGGYMYIYNIICIYIYYIDIYTPTCMYILVDVILP